MYFKSPQHIITKPHNFTERLLKNPNPPEVDLNRNLLIFPSSKQILPITSNPKNLKSSSRISDPLAPYSLSTRIIAEILVNYGLSGKSYLIYLGYIKDGGILVVDPTQMKPLNEGYTPYLNFSGLDAKIFERLNEKRKFKKGWYKAQGYKEEEVEEIKVVEDLEPERKAAKENRKIVRKNLKKFLESFLEKHQNKLKIFVFDSKSSFEYKAVYSSLKELKALDCLFHKNFQPGENYSSLEGLRKEIKHLLYQNGIEIREDLKLEKYFNDVDFNFNWPPEFDFQSNSYTIFLEEDLEKERNTIFGKIINDRVRYSQFLKRYRQFLKNFGFNDTEVEKRLESLPCYEPIESLIIKQEEKIGELKPFTKEIKSLEIKVDIFNSFSPSLFAVPCTLTRIQQALNVKIRELKEEEKIFLGTEYHKLILSDPEEMAYINHAIWRISGLNPIPRSFYTEKKICGEIEIDGKKIYFPGVVDAITVCDDEIIILDYKLSPVLPEKYKRGHAKQIFLYAKILESYGYKVGDIGILLYGIAPPSKPELKSSVTNRYAIFTSELEEELCENVKDYFYWLKELYYSPDDGMRKLRKEEEKRGCKICSSDVLAEQKDKAAIEAIKKIKQN